MLHLPTALASLSRRCLLRRLVLWMSFLLHDPAKRLRFKALAVATDKDDSRFAVDQQGLPVVGMIVAHLDTSLTKRGAVSTVTKTRT
jgi:hypothetical protein